MFYEKQDVLESTPFESSFLVVAEPDGDADEVQEPESDDDVDDMEEEEGGDMADDTGEDIPEEED